MLNDDGNEIWELEGAWSSLMYLNLLSDCGYTAQARQPACPISKIWTIDLSRTSGQESQSGGSIERDLLKNFFLVSAFGICPSESAGFRLDFVTVR
jgi:hypothetical protein